MDVCGGMGRWVAGYMCIRGVGLNCLAKREWEWVSWDFFGWRVGGVYSMYV